MLKVNPIVTIVAVLAGASLLGILGALIAIPTAAAIQILLSDAWSTRRARRERTTAPADAGTPRTGQVNAAGADADPGAAAS